MSKVLYSYNKVSFKVIIRSLSIVESIRQRGDAESLVSLGALLLLLSFAAFFLSKLFLHLSSGEHRGITDRLCSSLFTLRLLAPLHTPLYLIVQFNVRHRP